MKYTLTALFLSPLWLLVLSLTPGGKAIGLAPLGGIINGGMTEVFSLPILVVYALFPVISVGLALRFKKWLTETEGKERILPSLLLPAISTFVFVLACGIASHTLRNSPNGGFFGAAWFAVVYFVTHIWVIFPMGLFSHACLLWAHRSDQKKRMIRTRRDEQRLSRAHS